MSFEILATVSEVVFSLDSALDYCRPDDRSSPERPTRERSIYRANVRHIYQSSAALQVVRPIAAGYFRNATKAYAKVNKVHSIAYDRSVLWIFYSIVGFDLP